MTIYVDKVRDRLEGIEADADRQSDVRNRYGESHRGQLRTEEREVFEDGQDSEVEDQADDESCFSFLLVFVAYAQPHEVIHCDAGKEQEHVHGLSPGIEEKGESHQHGITVTREQQVTKSKCRQEDEEEKQIGKHHGLANYLKTALLQGRFFVTIAIS